jgi:uncharacterized protein (DUF4415 family)
MSKVVRKTLEECRPAAARKREMKKRAAQPDREIDLSDIPELTESFWQNAVRNPFYRPVKQQVTVRIDADVLAWLRAKGSRGYQSRLNSLLRSMMLQELKAKRKSA